MKKNIITFFTNIWFEDFAFIRHAKKWGWVDIPILLGCIGLFYCVISVAREWMGVLRPTIEIDLSVSRLPQYTLFSLTRGIIAYCFSLAFTLIYGYWAAKDKSAGKVLVPLLDVFQSIPVLGFMPGLVLTLVSLFPHSNIGLELSAILMIFTSQVWNMTFSFYNSISSIPSELRQAAKVYKFSILQNFKWVELPFAVIGLVWNSMMSMAGGWFFLMICETFVLGERDFRLPGVGSYMSVAVSQGNKTAMFYAIVSMVIMIVLLDQFLWRPVVAWSQKFKIEESCGIGSYGESFFLNWLKSSDVYFFLKRLFLYSRGIWGKAMQAKNMSHIGSKSYPEWIYRLGWGVYAVILAALGIGGWKIVFFLKQLGGSEWWFLLRSGLFTLGRVLLTLIFGTLWTVPAGLFIGLSPRISRIFQPIVQIVASFPAPMLFPLLILFSRRIGLSLGWGSIMLMLLGTQWYILFNVIAGAMAMPSDLKDVTRVYGFSRWQKLANLYIPTIFPYLITGWITAAGGAWNASIVAEYVVFNSKTITTDGLGALISVAADKADFPMLAGAVLVMSAIVVAFNKCVWKKLFVTARERYSLV